MSKEHLDKFCLLVLGNLRLQAELITLIDRDDFIKRLIELGADSGFDISREEIELQLRENKRLWHERWI